MGIEEIRTLIIKEEVLLDTGRLPRILIELRARVDNDKLREVVTESATIAQSLISSAVPRGQEWKYLERLIKFLNKVLDLQKK